VVHFAAAVYVEMGVVFEPEFFLFQEGSICFDLGFIFSEDFEEDAVVAF